MLKVAEINIIYTRTGIVCEDQIGPPIEDRCRHIYMLIIYDHYSKVYQM